MWREGLKVPKKQPKRGRLWLADGSCAEYRNHVGVANNELRAYFCHSVDHFNRGGSLSPLESRSLTCRVIGIAVRHLIHIATIASYPLHCQWCCTVITSKTQLFRLAAPRPAIRLNSLLFADHLRRWKSPSGSYGFTYIKWLLTDQKRMREDHLKKVRAEIDIFKKLQSDEDRLGAIARDPTTAADEIDRRARRTFLLYSDAARTWGYGFQADFMEEQIIPQLERQIEDEKAKKIAAISQMPKSARGYKDGEWKWGKVAGDVGMKAEYDFLYAYTSRLLHATPTSITTNQSDLELSLSERRLFIEFIVVSVVDLVEIAELSVAPGQQHPKH